MLRAEFADRICLVRCPEFNLSVSRNLGVSNSVGDVVAFIDDDAIPCRNWLEHIAGAYADTAVAGVGGRTHLVNPGLGQAQFIGGLVTVLAEQSDVIVNAFDRPSFTAPSHLVFPRFHGTNMTYRRQALVDIQGFDENFEYLFDDADLGVRFGLSGKRLVQLSNAVVYHAPSSGRNRGKHPYDLNWFSWLRSMLYFAIKNGGPTVGTRRALVHCLRTTSNFFAQVRDARDSGRMPEDLYRKAKGMLRKGAVIGVLQGLFRKRKFPSTISRADRDMIPFCRPEHKKSPSGQQSKSSNTKGTTELQDAPLRICLLSVGYPPASTHGVARSTATLARGLVELGHEVHVITAGRKMHITNRDGVLVHEVSSKDAARYGDFSHRSCENLAHWLNHSHAVFEAVESIVRNDGIQLVDSPLWGLEGLVTAVKGDIPVAVRVVTSMKQIAEIHGQPSPENEIIGDLEQRFLSMADLVISNSTATTHTLERVYGFGPSEPTIGLAPYGMVPAPEVAVDPLPSSEPDAPVVLFVGRLEKRKGVPELFKAIPRVLEVYPNARFVLAGSDNSAEDGFRDQHGMDYPTYFRKTAGPAASQVEFPGFVDEDTLEELYRSCDLFVAPSLYESFGLIFLEAMNWARPVIGCAAGGPEEIIVDGETGSLVPPGDAEALAEAICALLSDADLRRRLGLAGRQRLLDHFSQISMAKEFERLYRGLLETAHSSENLPSGGRGRDETENGELRCLNRNEKRSPPTTSSNGCETNWPPRDHRRLLWRADSAPFALCNRIFGENLSAAASPR